MKVRSLLDITTVVVLVELQFPRIETGAVMVYEPEWLWGNLCAFGYIASICICLADRRGVHKFNRAKGVLKACIEI